MSRAGVAAVSPSISIGLEALAVASRSRRRGLLPPVSVLPALAPCCYGALVSGASVQAARSGELVDGRVMREANALKLIVAERPRSDLQGNDIIILLDGTSVGPTCQSDLWTVRLDGR